MKTAITLFSLFFFFATCHAAIKNFPVEKDFVLPSNAQALPVMEYLRRYTPAVKFSKREYRFPETVNCGADTSTTVYQNGNEWFVQNCASTPIKPVFRFTATNNVFAYEDCLQPKTRKYLWWMNGNPTLKLAISAATAC